MRKTVQEIFLQTPPQKQVMMYSATLSKEIRPVCKKFCQDVMLTTNTSSTMITPSSTTPIISMKQRMHPNPRAHNNHHHQAQSRILQRGVHAYPMMRIGRR